MTEITPKAFTGRKMLAVMLSFFGVIITVNMYMAYSAVSTFPGLEVKNSYLASQEFNQRAEAQRALGWEASISQDGNAVVLQLLDKDGNTVIPESMVAKIGRPTYAGEDIDLTFQLVDNEYRADAALADGPWRFFLDAVAQDGTRYKKRLHLSVGTPVGPLAGEPSE